MNYWEECISIAAEECGLTLTDEQLKYLTDAVEGGHENYGMAHGYDCIPNPIESQAKSELQSLKRQMQKDDEWKASTKPCPACNTNGWVKDGWGRDTTCIECDGKGRVKIHW